MRVSRKGWRNWSRELECRPGRLYCDLPGGTHPSPRSLEDLQAIVRDALALGVSVRAFGSSHSWAALCPVDGGFLVDNRMIGAVGDRYELSVTPPSADGTRKAVATCPPGLISKEFEDWLWDMGYTLPSSAFEDCFTMGGMAATATHGVGIDIPTLSDMVVGVTFIDGLGEVRHWNRETATPDELAAAQCSLGCLGLVYSYSFEVEPRYEVISDAFVLPYDSLFADTDEARKRLRELHESYATVEIFWWPYVFSKLPFFSKFAVNPELWILTTRRLTTETEKLRPRSRLHKWLLFNVLDLPMMIFGGYFTRFLVRHRALVCLLPLSTAFTRAWVNRRRGPQRLPQYDANHLVNAAGVEWVLCQAIEWNMPFRPAAADDESDGFERVRKAFATLRTMVEEALEQYVWHDPRATPVTVAIEMRTLAASSALLSPGYQPPETRQHVRYAAPEVVTAARHPAWEAFAHEANIRFTTDRASFGNQVRPHLAKEARDYPHPEFGSGGMTDYMRAQYIAAGTWQRFLAVREAVDPEGVFLNPFLREWFYGEEQRVALSDIQNQVHGFQQQNGKDRSDVLVS
ncbi:MAG TPA: FAD-binding protein [Pseudomonadales bacterium]|nr:FAD-binding protein [Pseudomonadales bacterium]